MAGSNPGVGAHPGSIFACLQNMMFCVSGVGFMACIMHHAAAMRTALSQQHDPRARCYVLLRGFTFLLAKVLPAVLGPPLE